MPTEGASCGAVVKGLGGSEENCLDLDIHRFKGGKYKAQLVYVADEACTLTLDVNGTCQQLELPASEGFASIPIVMKLHRGCNKISFSNASAILPLSIDKLSFYKP